MKIALFGKDYNQDQKVYLQMLIDELKKRQAQLKIYQPYFHKLSQQFAFQS
jgi:hypothetical protein